VFQTCEQEVMDVPLAGTDAMISKDQCRAARELLTWTREDLAKGASVSAGTVKNFEAGRKVLPALAVAIERALTDAGIWFIHDDDVGGEGVRWRKSRLRKPAAPTIAPGTGDDQ
jgi:DNA-binding XRE family transcriptional regulator